ncbi:ABC transporter ATP-binding protein [Paucilactobacillus suebicus]|nr:ABC transporter ATP-binding protein [Paucilactobacillus suebicus]
MDEQTPIMGSMFKFVFGTVLKKRWLLVLNVIALTIITLLQFVVPQIEQYIIDKVIPDKSVARLLAVIGILIVSALVLAAFNFLSTYYMSVMSQNAITELRNNLYDDILKQDTAFFEDRKTGDLMTRLTSDINNLQSLISSNMLSVIGNMFTFVGVLILIFWINWEMALAVSLTFPLMFLVYRVFRTRIHQAFRAARATQGQMSDRMQETLTQIDLIKSYTSEPYEMDRFGKIADKNRKNMISAGYNQAIFSPSIDTINYLGVAIILLLGALFIMKGQLTVGQLVAYISYVAMVQSPIQSLSRLLNQLQQALVSYGRIEQVSSYEPQVNDAPDAVDFPGIHEGVSVDHINFSYNNQPILNDVSFDIPAGKTTALVGRSGSGKTTITRMLVRLYDLDSGDIKYDGVSIRDMKMSSLRENVAIVSQDIYMIDGSIRDNVVYGRQGASYDDIWRVLDLADLKSFVESLPDQLDTQVGERGMKLSGGQKQRVAIARALLKDAPLIILDEATASLDNESEKAIQHALDNLLQERTSLVIAHRLSTIQNADQIIVLDSGKVVETGDHQSLMDKNGAYARLYKAQFE